MIIFTRAGATLGEKRVRGFVFRRHVGDHPPDHVHISSHGRKIGRWDIDNQRPLDDFTVTRRLAKALAEAGYLRREQE